MRTSIRPFIVAFAICTSLLTPALLAKDEPVSLEDCPEAVKAVIKQYSSRGTVEGIALDKKKKSGGPAVYEAKFSMPDGNRIELHISVDGKILDVEEKRRKS